MPLDPAPTVALTGGFPPNSLFPVGTTVVEYTATDCAGNTGVGTFEVLVRDVTPARNFCADETPTGQRGPGRDRGAGDLCGTGCHRRL